MKYVSFMAPFTASFVLAAFAWPLAGVTTQVAVTATARDFLSGEARGTAVSADGRLTLGVSFGDRSWPDEAADAVVFGAASDSTGRVFVATGGGLGRLFVSVPSGKTTLLFEAAEPNLTAVAVAPDGSVVVGASPGGRVYRIPAAQAGAAKPVEGPLLGETGEQAVWALAFGPDGSLFVGTGNKGRVYKVPQGGKAGLFAEIEDTHIRSLVVGKDGTVYAGTSDHGLVVSIAAAGGGTPTAPGLRTLHDFGKPEVTGLVLNDAGTLYAVATSAEPPALGSAVSDARGRAPVAAASAPKDDVPKGTVSVTTSAARLAPASRADVAQTANAEIVAIAKDGFVEPAWALPEDTVYGMRLDAKSGELVLATGPRGRVYTLKDRKLRLAAQLLEKQVVAAPVVPGGFAAVTTGAPGVFHPRDREKAGEFLSAPKDAARLARFARLRHEGVVPPGASLKFSVRSGNAEKPDGTWAPWAALAADGTSTGISAPPAGRYLQWRVEMTPAPKGDGPVLERVEMSYLEQNARPILEGVVVLEPGAVFSRSSGSGTAVLSVTNPDENGVYAGLEGPREPDAKKLFRKGFRTVQWRASDPNGDPLRYLVEARAAAGTVWFPIRRDEDDSYVSFDTSALPDGRYRFRVTASDRLANPEGQALVVSEEAPLATIDNAPAALRVVSQKVEGEVLVAVVEAADALSSITKAELAINADRWRLLSPDDGASDGPKEQYTIRVAKPKEPSVLSVRVLDSSGNVTAISLEFPGLFEESKR